MAGACRLAGQNASQAAQGAKEAADRRSQQRLDAYDRQLAALPGRQQELLRDFQQQARRQQEQVRQSLLGLQRRQQDYFERRCGEIENDLRLAKDKFDDKLTKLAGTIDQRFHEEAGTWTVRSPTRGSSSNRRWINSAAHCKGKSTG